MNAEQIVAEVNLHGIKGILPGDHAKRLAKASLMASGPRLEIGVLAGLSTCLIGLATPNNVKLISVDPFKVEYLSDMAKDVIKSVSGEAALEKESFFDSWVKQTRKALFGKNLVPLIGDRLDSVLLEQVSNNLRGTDGLGLLFIDGLHEYEDIKKDIEAYLPFVKKDGTVVFHDYAPGWGVYDAVNESVKANKIKIVDNGYLLITRKV